MVSLDGAEGARGHPLCAGEPPRLARLAVVVGRVGLEGTRRARGAVAGPMARRDEPDRAPAQKKEEEKMVKSNEQLAKGQQTTRGND